MKPKYICWAFALFELLIAIVCIFDIFDRHPIFYRAILCISAFELMIRHFSDSTKNYEKKEEKNDCGCND